MDIRKKFTTTLDEEVIKQLKLQAIQEQTDANKIIERLIKDYLKKTTRTERALLDKTSIQDTRPTKNT